MSGFRIGAVWAFLAVDPDDGDEGVVGMATPAGWIPFVAADERRLVDLREHAVAIARATGRSIELVRFDVRTDVETIDPA